jgi:glycosyltransferase involved in cell wall biosynthesis
LEKYFVVGNVGTNTARKRLDLFIEGFSKFAKNKDDVKCLIHTSDDNAYNIESVIDDNNVAGKCIMSTSNLTVENMIYLYNMMDVNVNTSMGEGFCLPLLEGASCGVPVLCTASCNLMDVWSAGADFINVERSEWVSGTGFKGDVIDVDDFSHKLNHLYEDKEYRLKLGKDAMIHSKNIKFSWDNITSIIYDDVNNINNDRISTIEI